MGDSTQTMNISLPAAMRAFVERQVAAGGYSTASEYVRELIRQAQKAAEKQRLETLLIEGLQSGSAVPVTEQLFDELRTRAEKKKPRRTRRG
ncbi:MAG: type II toxin-antitoxin system ParD family antitoxin [Planctomycetota bacterium]